MELYKTTSDGTTVPTANNIDGRQLSRRLKKLSTAKRALLAHDLEHGAHLHNLTRAQAAAVTLIAPSYIGTVDRASAEERNRLACGWVTLSSLHRRRRPLTDSEVQCIVRKIGVDRIWRILDALTSPVLEAAE
jgi:hypothetical protein